jgi:hypothetical protein
MPDGERVATVNEMEGPSARWREAFATLGERAAPGPDCPEPDRLWAAAMAEGPVEERQEIVAHTASCASCAAAFRLARGLARDEAGQTGRIEPPVRLADRRWIRWGAPVAALAAALVLAILVPRFWNSGPAPYRGGETREIFSKLPEGALLPRDRADLRWSAGPPGSRYEVRVLTAGGGEVAVESDLETPEYRIPPSALRDVAAGTVLYWQVKSLAPDGKSTVSKTFSARLP